MKNKKFSKLKVEFMSYCCTEMADKILMTSCNFSLVRRVGVRVSRAFTLAEVLITLVVVGVVAAVTVPMLLHQEGDRVNSERHANIVYKIAQATDMMKANGNLGKFSTTDEFVDELQKYLKINKRCDSNHIDECWTTSKVKTMSGEEYEVKNAKTRKDLLGDEINNPDNPNVGIILADGAHIILTYNSDFEGVTPGDTTVHTPGLLPIGNGKEEFLNYTSNTMGGLAFIFDVDGNRGSNSERQGENSYKDIRNFNGARFIPESDFDPCKGKNPSPCCKWNYERKLAVGNTCYFQLPTKYNWASAKSACPSGSTYTGSPNKEALQNICKSIYSTLNGAKSPFSDMEWFWTVTEGGGTNSAYPVLFTDQNESDKCRFGCRGGCYNSKPEYYNVLCAGK